MGEESIVLVFECGTVNAIFGGMCLNNTLFAPSPHQAKRHRARKAGHGQATDTPKDYSCTIYTCIC